MVKLRRFVFGVVTAAVMLGALEGLLYLLMPVVRTASLPDTMIRAHLETPGFRYDPDLYWYWARLPSDAMQINEHGFRRTKPMTREKPPGVTRVIVFGDSQTLGAGVSPEETYSAFAEAALGEGWEVLDAGISGYRTLNVYRLLQRRIEAYDPDIIVVDCMPFDSPRDDGGIQGTPVGGIGTQVRALLFRSRIYALLRIGVDKVRPDRDRWLDRSALPGDALGHGNHDHILEWGEARGVQVVWMEYPVGENGRVSCQTLPGELPEGPPVVPACQALLADGRPASVLFQDRNHLTVAGNQVVGAAVAETLRGLR